MSETNMLKFYRDVVAMEWALPIMVKPVLEDFNRILLDESPAAARAGLGSRLLLDPDGMI